MTKELQKYERKAETEKKLAEVNPYPETEEITEKHEQISNVKTEYNVGKNTKVFIHEPKKQRTTIKFKRNKQLIPIAFIDKDLAIYFDIEKSEDYLYQFQPKNLPRRTILNKNKVLWLLAYAITEIYGEKALKPYPCGKPRELWRSKKLMKKIYAILQRRELTYAHAL